jgi:penicillin-binding protein
MPRSQAKKTTNTGKKIGLVAGAVVIVAVVAGIVVYNKQAETRIAKKAEENYLAQLAKNNNDKKLFSYFSESSIKKSGYTTASAQTKYRTIYDAAAVSNLKITDSSLKKDSAGKYQLTYKVSMKTTYGTVKNLAYKTTVSVNNKKATVAWKPGLIFPGMSEKDKVSVAGDTVNRGKILDRNGVELATQKSVQQLGINPSLLGTGSEKTTNLAAISTMFGVSTAELNSALSAGWATGNVFVPIKTLSDDEAVSDESTLPTGAVLGSTTTRYYPLGESAASLIGYVGNVTAEDIKKNSQLAAGDQIGKSGLESAYDKQLRGSAGGAITITDKNGKTKKTVISKKTVQGKDITLTIDSNVQTLAYSALGANPASTVVMEPTTGDLLALVSSPSYDPNKMTQGISTADYKTYTDDANKPFQERFATRYAPGSTFKTITGAIGLDAGTLDPSEKLSISGLKWQKDTSWGSYEVTRVKEADSVDLATAYANSDNIYFAQQTLKMGEKTFRAGLNKFIFGKDLNLPISMSAASISNDDSFATEILLADTGYGQGQLQISPIQQVAMYSVFMNDGALVYPRLTTDTAVKKDDNVIKSSSASTVLQDLIPVVSDSAGYAHAVYNAGFNLAAKTGTAEIKDKQDTTGTQNSFLLFMDADNQKFMGVTMVENSLTNGTATDKSAALVKYLEDTYK